MAAQQALPEASEVPIALPVHVRRLVRRCPDGAPVNILRGPVVIATLVSEGQTQLLENIRRVIAQDSSRRGHAVYTLDVDGQETLWDSAESDEAPRGDQRNEAMSYARAMEGVVFRLVDKVLESIDQQQKAADRRETIAATNAQHLADALQRLGDAIAATTKTDAKVELAEIEASQEQSRIDAALKIWEALKGNAVDKDGEAQPRTKVARVILAALSNTQRAAVTKTAAGKGIVQAATEEEAAAAIGEALTLAEGAGVIEQGNAASLRTLLEAVLAK